LALLGEAPGERDRERRLARPARGEVADRDDRDGGTVLGEDASPVESAPRGDAEGEHPRSGAQSSPHDRGERPASLGTDDGEVGRAVDATLPGGKTKARWDVGQGLILASCA